MYKVLLVGDFNGKVTPFEDPSKQTSNGKVIENILDVTELVLLNTDKECTYKTTLSRGLLNSVIVMCFEEIWDSVDTMTIDEEKLYSIGSDHNFIAINRIIPTSIDQAQKNDNSEQIVKLDISENTNWKAFALTTRAIFADWDNGSFKHCGQHV